MPATIHDVAILADFRFAGPAVAAEVRAQAEAALTTVLVHVPRPHEQRALPFAPPIRDLIRDGVATLARDNRPVTARLLIVHRSDPPAGDLARVRAERTVVVAERPPAHDLAEPVEWAPVDARVRAAMPPECLLSSQDWHEVVDVAAWWRDHDGRTDEAPAGWDVTAPAGELRRTLERRYGHQSHLKRLAVLGIRPRISAPARRREPGEDAATAPSRRVLMVGDDEAGLGDLARLMAIARRLPGDMAAVIATQSYGAPIAHREGFLTEYIPSRRLLRDRLAHLIELHRPEVVAVDSVPHEGIVEAVRDHPGVIWVWVRRAMWPSGVGDEWITEGKVFDHVLEPGEFAARADDGPTVADRANAHRFDPITFLDARELLDVAAARAGLELDDRPAALLRLGADTIDDLSSPVARIVERLTRHGFQLVLAEPATATAPMPAGPGLRVVPGHPAGRYLRAFDLVVSTAGYHPAHEQLGFAVPTVFLPDRRAGLDDQVARARFAEAAGVALVVGDPESEELERVLDAAARPEVRSALRRRCEELTFGNGAAAAATWLSGLAARWGRTGG